MKRRIGIIVFFILLGLTQNILADYPIVSHRFLADPGALVYNGRVYLYCSNDDENPIEDGSYQMKSIVCVSSSDLKNWTDHGIVFKIPRDASWAGNSWAPSPAYRNGKFYLYFANGASNIGVAVADSPIGPFKDPIGGSLVNGNTPGIYPATDMWLFDPMTFIDDDGQAYIYCGGNNDNNVRVIKLNEDMISLDSSAIKLSAPNFFEALWMHKHNGKYYLSYSTTPNAGMRIDYMISNSPTSGFTYGGIISQQPPQNNNNNHQANFKFNGQWYQAYHNRVVAYENNIPPVYKRNICLDKFSHNDDGTINIMVNTVDGLEQLAYLNPYERVEAETMDDQNGIYTEVCNSGGMNVTDIENGDWIKVRGVDFDSLGPALFKASVAMDSKIGVSLADEISIRIDAIDGRLIGNLPVSYTGGSDVWKTEITPIDTVTGVHDVYFIFLGEETEDLFRFDHWQFIERSDTNELIAIDAVPFEYKIDTISGSNKSSIKVTAIYADGTTEDVTSLTTFNYDTANIVSITDSIQGINYGEVTVTANFNGKTDEFIMIVKNIESELSVKQLSADKEYHELFTGSSSFVVISAEYYDGHIQVLTDNANVENPNPAVATLTDGLIQAVGEGDVDITVSYKGEMGETQSVVIYVSVHNRDAFARNEAESFDEESGTQTEAVTDTGGGEDVGFIEDQDWLRFNGVDFGDGPASLQLRVASATSGGQIDVRIDRRSGKRIATCEVSGTGGWQNWKTFKCPVSEVTGLHDIYLIFKGEDGYLFNINWWQFSDEVVVGIEDVSVSESEVISTEYYSLTGQKINNLDNLTGIFIVKKYMSDGTISTTKFFKSR